MTENPRLQFHSIHISEMADEKLDVPEAKYIEEQGTGFRDGLFCDGTIKCGTRTWKIHRIIVIADSEFFKKAFTADFKVGGSVL